MKVFREEAQEASESACDCSIGKGSAAFVLAYACRVGGALHGEDKAQAQTSVVRARKGTQEVRLADFVIEPAMNHQALV